MVAVGMIDSSQQRRFRRSSSKAVASTLPTNERPCGWALMFVTVVLLLSAHERSVWSVVDATAATTAAFVSHQRHHRSFALRPRILSASSPLSRLSAAATSSSSGGQAHDGSAAAASAGSSEQQRKTSMRGAERRPRPGDFPTAVAATTTTAAFATNGDDSEKSPLEVVMKFGGSSLADYERLDHVARLIQSQIESGQSRPRAVVCSAMGKTTNNLLAAGDVALKQRALLQSKKDAPVDNNDDDDTSHDYMQQMNTIRELHTTVLEKFALPVSVKTEVMDLLDECADLLKGVSLIQELSPKSLDQLVSYGERCSVRLVAARLQQLGIAATAYDAWTVGIRTDSDFGNAQIDVTACVPHICAAFGAMDNPLEAVAIVTGFIAHDPLGRVTTLGRGGSDLTATTLGAALNVDEIQVWKDVDGILTCDPRMIPQAIPVPDVSYEEAAELAYFGAQVLHPIAMQPAMLANVPVRVKNSYNPSAIGTLIRNVKTNTFLVTAITFKQNIKLMDIQSTQMLGAYGFLAKVFGEFEKRKLSVDVLASSEVSVSLTLDKKQNDEAIQGLMADLSATCADVKVSDQKSILTLIADVRRSSEVLATVFKAFAEEGINVEMMSQGASKVNISFILDGSDLEPAVKALHRCFFEQGGLAKADKETAALIEQQ